jgi:nicotinamide mononucleotide adenylyltransferase
MPISIPCYTTICEQWNEEKIEVLRALGYDVRVLYQRDHKAISGAAIRRDIAAGGESWKDRVPQATVRAVEQLNLRNRLLKLLQPDGASSALAKSSYPPLDAS